MARLTYLAVLAGCLLGTLPLEIWLGVRVYRRPRRWLRAIAPTFVLFLGWDWYAIGRHQWAYDPRQTTGVLLPGRLPVEEVLFFLVVPTCAILAFEAARAVRGWPAGDEPDPAGTDGPGPPP
jgi:lycopene cyclase domain-containing protein